MMVGLSVGGCAYSLTSVPQMPPTSIFSSALSDGTSGIGYSRISVLLGPVLTAASTFSATFFVLFPSWPAARVRPFTSSPVIGLYYARLQQEKPTAHCRARPRAGMGTRALRVGRRRNPGR